MIFRPARNDGDPRFLEIKILVLVVGAGAGMAGMMMDRAWLVWTGIGILLLGVALRFLARRS